MSEKRKDSKGRILRTGESQRKDLIYQYRKDKTYCKYYDEFVVLLGPRRRADGKDH